MKKLQWMFVVAVLLATALAVYAETNGSDLLARAQQIRAQRASSPNLSVRYNCNPLLLPLCMHDYVEARRLYDNLAALPDDNHSRWFGYSWLFVTEDLATVDRLTQARLAADTTDVASLLARGELDYRLLRYDDARKMNEAVLRQIAVPKHRALAVLGLSKILYKELNYPPALDTLAALYDSTTLDRDIIFQTALTLIQLGRVNDAVNFFEEMIHWCFVGERPHYFLGNGFTRLNYTQLEQKYPEQLADSSARIMLQTAYDALNRGELEPAAALAKATFDVYPQYAPSLVLLGSLEWSRGNFERSADYFRKALDRCPEYGRAHAGLAKALEGMRMRVNVHRAADSIKFAETPMPDVPRIDEFVLNWKSLAPRHQKEVALSMAPWKAYIPVLIECGSFYYIKPLHELLSDCPNMGPIRDQRIDYDSRLWDDVRGAGGFTTITGVEDVERQIYNSSNTVLHELTHQVHGIFPAEDQQKILDAFHAARAREDGGIPTFMSQYQQASVWEYFAEGANAYYNSRRDDYDTRDVVRERLLELDPPLVKLVEYYTAAPNLEACYAVGLVNAAEDALTTADTVKAVERITNAYRRAPQDQIVLQEISHIRSILDDDPAAIAFADTLAILFPQKAAAYVQRAEARYLSDGNAEACIDILKQGLENAETAELKKVRQSLGNYLLNAGRYAEAAAQYRAILDEVRDDPSAQWGWADALGKLGEAATADSVFLEAINRRSGIPELRLAYVEFLIKQNRLDDAATQIHEAELLAPDDEMVATGKAQLLIEQGDWNGARTLLEQAAQSLPEYRLSSVLLLKVLRHLHEDTDGEFAAVVTAMRNTDVPRWVFVPRKAYYVTLQTWPQEQKELLDEVLGNE